MGQRKEKDSDVTRRRHYLADRFPFTGIPSSIMSLLRASHDESYNSSSFLLYSYSVFNHIHTTKPVSVGDVARITSSAADGEVYPSRRVGVPNALSLVVLDELKSFLKDERKRFAGATRAESFKRLDDWIERKLAQVLCDPEAPAHSNLQPTGSQIDRSSPGDFRRTTSARGYAQGHETNSNRGKRKDASQEEEQSQEEHGTISEHGKDDDGQALLPKSPPMRGVRSSAAGSSAPSGRPTLSPDLFVAGGRYPYPYKRSVSFLPAELPHSPTGQAAQGLALREQGQQNTRDSGETGALRAALGDTSPAAVSSAQSRASSSALSLGYFAEPCRWSRVPIGVGVAHAPETRISIVHQDESRSSTTPSVWWRGEKTRTRGWGVAPYAVDDAAAPVRMSVCAVERVGEKSHFCIVFTK